MAITYNNTSGSSGTGNTLTFSHTLSADFVAIAAIHQLANSGISTVTVGGVEAAYLTRAKYAGGNYWVYLHYIVGDFSGAQDIVITASGANSGPIAAASISLSGVDQVTPIHTSGITEQASAYSISHTLTTSLDDCWGISTALAFNNDCSLLSTTNSLTTKRQCFTDMLSLGDSNGVIANGSVTLGWNNSSVAQLNAMVALAVQPAAASSPAFVPSAVFL